MDSNKYCFLCRQRLLASRNKPSPGEDSIQAGEAASLPCLANHGQPCTCPMTVTEARIIAVKGIKIIILRNGRPCHIAPAALTIDEHAGYCTTEK